MKIVERWSQCLWKRKTLFMYVSNWDCLGGSFSLLLFFIYGFMYLFTFFHQATICIDDASLLLPHRRVITLVWPGGFSVTPWNERTPSALSWQRIVGTTFQGVPTPYRVPPVLQKGPQWARQSLWMSSVVLGDFWSVPGNILLKYLFCKYLVFYFCSIVSSVSFVIISGNMGASLSICIASIQYKHCNIVSINGDMGPLFPGRDGEPRGRKGERRRKAQVTPIITFMLGSMSIG